MAVRLVRPGGGSALPGLVVSKFAPGLLLRVLRSFSDGLVVITGSAGKSTTTKMVVAILRDHGLKVFTNPTTANIEQGFFATILEKSDLLGRVRGDIAVLEMDEAHAASVSKRIKPRLATLLNVLEDQIDRFQDPSFVRNDLAEVAQTATEGVVLNADDQNILLIHSQSKVLASVSWFGLSENLLAGERKGLGTAPTYLNEISKPPADTVGTSLTDGCLTVVHRSETAEVKLPSRGLHFAVDAVAALETSRRILGSGFDLARAAQTLSELPPVFARGEVREVRGEPVEFILVQNPSSFQLNLDSLNTKPEQILFAIGTDVHDPSWLWTVDLSGLTHANVVTGYNSAEAALLLEYNEIPYDQCIADLQEALDTFFGLPKPSRGMKTVIFSADAMRRTRRILGFTDPEDVNR